MTHKLGKVPFLLTPLIVLGLIISQSQAAEPAPNGTLSSGKKTILSNVANLLPSPLSEIGKLSASDLARLQTVGDNKPIDLQLPTGITQGNLVVFAFQKDGSLKPCVSYAISGKSALLSSQDLRCKQQGDAPLGQLLALQTEQGVSPLVRVEHKPASIVDAGDDIGIALSILDRSRDGEGSRFLDGASFYYSLSNLKSDSFRAIASLSALDFNDEVDFETGLSLGILLKPKDLTRASNQGFAFSLTYGYNFMADTADDGWYSMIGFGWNFGRGQQ